MTVEYQQFLDNIQVQLYSGVNDLLLEYFDVQFNVQLSGGGSATLSMCLYQVQIATKFIMILNETFCRDGFFNE